jgi:hypothetical protein
MTTAFACRDADGQLQSADLPEEVRDALEGWKNQQA